MRTIVTGRNLDIPDDDREYVMRKMGRLERLLRIRFEGPDGPGPSGRHRAVGRERDKDGRD